MTTEEVESGTSIMMFADEPHATELLGRMLVVKYDQRHPDYVVQGRIERIWTREDEPNVLRIKLTGMMRYFYDPEDVQKSVWRYEEEDTRTLQLREMGLRANSVTRDPTNEDIFLVLIGQGYNIKITSPDTKHPKPDDILPATGPIRSSQL